MFSHVSGVVEAVLWSVYGMQPNADVVSLLSLNEQTIILAP